MRRGLTDVAMVMVTAQIHKRVEIEKSLDPYGDIL